MDLNKKIDQIKNTPSDINEHITTLMAYTTRCNHVTEMGVRGIVSTWAFIAGKPKTLISYDIQPPSKWGGDVDMVKQVAKDNGVDWEFIQGDTLKITIEPTDLLFIDTWHAYKQLRAELQLHSDKVGKYIILHDTTSFATKDETSYEHWGEEFKAEGIGLWRAVEEFLDENKNWSLRYRYTNNNGLTILERNG